MLDKRIVVLKQIVEGYNTGSTLSAITRLETEDGVTTLFFSPVNFKGLSHGEYFLFLIDQSNEIHRFGLGCRPVSFSHTFERAIGVSGFACGVAVIEDDIPLLVAFQRESKCNTEIVDFKRRVCDYVLLQKKAREKREKELENLYNDEAVATENYYDIPDGQNDNHLEKDGNDTVYEQLDNSQNVDDVLSDLDDFFKGEENGKVFNENEPTSCECEETEKEISKDSAPFEDEKSFDGEKAPYYLKVKDELEKVLTTFEKEKSLSMTFPFSSFVKIPYGNNKYYTVGIIKKDNLPKYICYGVPSEYKENPPKELDGYCTFIPLSVFNIHGNGYFMMFQDAITGECVKVSS